MGHHKIPNKILKQPILKYIWLQTHRHNSNFILLVVGLPGKGKSYAALSFLESLMVDESGKSKLTAENCMDNVCFSVQDFRERIEKAQQNDVVVLEESGVLANARNFYEQSNINLSSVFQTMRFRNQVIILTLPAGSYLDKQLRNLVHGTLVMKGHDDQESHGKFFLHSYNAMRNQIYQKYFRFFDSDGTAYKITKLRFRKPSAWLTELYEVKHTAWKRKLQKKIDVEERRNEEMASMIAGTDFDSALEFAEKNWEQYYDKKNNRFVAEALMTDRELRKVSYVSKGIAYSIIKILKFKKDQNKLF